MGKYFNIEGYWKDDRSKFGGYIVKEFDDVEENEEDDDLIFHYGLSESDIQEAIEDEKNGVENGLDFAITNYEVLDFDKYKN